MIARSVDGVRRTLKWCSMSEDRYRCAEVIPVPHLTTSNESDLSLFFPLGQGGSRDGSNTRRYVQRCGLSIKVLVRNEKEERNGNVKNVSSVSYLSHGIRDFCRCF